MNEKVKLRWWYFWLIVFILLNILSCEEDRFDYCMCTEYYWEQNIEGKYELEGSLGLGCVTPRTLEEDLKYKTNKRYARTIECEYE